MKNSVVEKAWEEYFAATKIDDIDALRKEGWRTVYEVAEATGRARNTVAASSVFEHKNVKLIGASGTIRNHTLIRPKIKG